MKLRTITFLWIDPCPNPRLARAQETLRQSVEGMGLQPRLFPAGPKLVKFRDVLAHAREGCPAGGSFVWCNSDVRLLRDPYALEDGKTMFGFHRTEIPSGEICGGVDMYLIPAALWDSVLSRDVPDLWCGATHIDWWLTRAGILAGCYQARNHFISHETHPESPASKSGKNPHYRHNIREYNRWAVRNKTERHLSEVRLPGIGKSTSPLRDYPRYWLWLLCGKKKKDAQP